MAAHATLFWMGVGKGRQEWITVGLPVSVSGRCNSIRPEVIDVGGDVAGQWPVMVGRTDLKERWSDR